MIDTTDPVIEQFIEDVHKCLERRQKKLSNTAEYAVEVRESRLLRLMCDDWTLEPRRYADTLNEKYGYNLRGDDVIEIFRKNRCSSQDNRNALFKASTVVADAFAQALTSRTQAAYDNYMARRKSTIQIESHSRIADRVICLMLYKKYPVLAVDDDLHALEKFGNVFMRYFLYDISDLLKVFCGVAKRLPRDENTQDDIESAAMTDSMLSRSETSLKDLQEKFNAHIAQSRQGKATEFFSRMSPDKYVSMFYAVLNAQAAVNQMRGKNVTLPPELDSLFILMEQLTNFIGDGEIKIPADEQDF